jgi:hypothetical protein
MHPTGNRSRSWRDRAPRSITDPCDSQGRPVFTSTDRRWLWHLESWLAVTAPQDSQLAQVRRDLAEYLQETCEHHWIHLPADGCCPAMRQCTWCHETEITGGDAG